LSVPDLTFLGFFDEILINKKWGGGVDGIYMIFENHNYETGKWFISQ